MTSALPIPAELAAVAAEAWALLVADPCPCPGIAVDYVRERGECEDVEAVRRALYGAAADWVAEFRTTLLEYKRPDDNPGSFSHQVVHLIRVGEFDECGTMIEHWNRPTGADVYREFSAKTTEACALCRLIAGETP